MTSLFRATTGLALLTVAASSLRAQQTVERRIAAVPLRKAGTTTEVANAAAWLLSDRASQISGVVLPVDGGYSA